MKLVVSPAALADLDRLRAFLAAEDSVAAQRATQRIRDGIAALMDFPLGTAAAAIGRPRENNTLR